MILRFPPSPTGLLHLGSARTALFNYLCAKHNDGEIVFRWEDTDRERSKTEHETEILEGLKWLGMDFEKESGVLHRQTENEAYHKEQLQVLWEKGAAFPCFATKEELDAQRQKAQKEKTNFVYWSASRDEDRATLEKKMAAGENYVWRLKVPKDQTIIWNDLIRGEIAVDTNTIGDFVIARSDQSILYPLANVLDDYQQGITHVLRGEDGISNTPKQILIFKAFEANTPEYGHIPLVLDQRKRKLSKRNVEPGVCVLISDFQKQGFLPQAVVNGLAFLGWNPKSTDEIFSLEELIKIFDLKNVNPAAAQYDFEKMKWFNHQWMRKLSVEEIITAYTNFQGEGEIIEVSETDSKLTKAAFEEAREKARTLPELTETLTYLIQDPGLDETKLEHQKMKIDLPQAKSMIQEALKMVQAIPEDQFNREVIRAKAVETIARLECKNGQFLWPFRVALSNTERSSGPFEIGEIIGKEETVRRLERGVS